MSTGETAIETTDSDNPLGAPVRKETDLNETVTFPANSGITAESEPSSAKAIETNRPKEETDVWTS